VIFPTPTSPIRITLQTKLVLSLLAVVLVSGLGALFVGQMVINHSIIKQAFGEAAQKLEIFSEAYANRLYVKQRLIASLATYRDFQRAVETRQRGQIHSALRGVGEPHFDFLNVADADGKVLVRSQDYSSWGDSITEDKYVRAVIRDKRPVSGYDIMDAAALEREDSALAARAAIPIKSPPSQPDSAPETETRGLVLKVAAPIWKDNVFVGVIYGVFLLNRDTNILDRAKNLLGEEKINGKDLVSATLFLNGTRISTTVRDENGERALGHRRLPADQGYRGAHRRGNLYRPAGREIRQDEGGHQQVLSRDVCFRRAFFAVSSHLSRTPLDSTDRLAGQGSRGNHRRRLQKSRNRYP